MGKFGAGRGSRIPTPLKATVSKTVLSHQFHHSGILKVAHASCTCSQQPLPFSNERRSQFWTYGKATPFPHDLMLTCVERMTRIELATSDWKSEVLPLNYIRRLSRAIYNSRHGEPHMKKKQEISLTSSRSARDSRVRNRALFY